MLQPISATYNSLLSLVNDTKIIAAAEIGSVMDPAQLKLYQADWVYFIVWSGDFISGGVWNTIDWLKSVYTSEYVLTLDEIQGWKSGGDAGSTTTSAVATTTKSTTTAVVPITTSSGSGTTTSRTTSTTPSTHAGTTISTTTRTSSTASATATGGAPHWGQCGGIGWTGPTTCQSPWVCTYSVSSAPRNNISWPSLMFS